MLDAPKLRRDDEMTPPDDEDIAELEQRIEARDRYQEMMQEIRRENRD